MIDLSFKRVINKIIKKLFKIDLHTKQAQSPKQTDLMY